MTEEDQRPKTEDQRPNKKVKPFEREEKKAVNREQYNKVKKELEKAKKQAEEYLHDLKRIKAEFENYRKRIEKEKDSLFQYASSSLINSFLPVLDNFERAILSAKENCENNKLSEGVELIYKQFKEILEKEGLRPIEAEGKKFDPNLHEAVMQVESKEHDDNTIVDVLQGGYLFKDRVLRPAMVKVARAVSQEEGKE